jgi:hypothetical protein
MPTSAPKLANIRTFDQLLRYLEDELDWPVDEMEIDDLTFDYDAEKDLGLDPKSAAKIKIIKQLRPLDKDQPFGIFFIEFEPKSLPVVVMRRILGKLVARKRESANPSHRPTWAQDDLLFISACGEDKARRIDFAHFFKHPEKSAPSVRLLGWDPGEPAAKLDWVDQCLRNSLRWPSNANPSVWRQSWTRAFESRPSRERGPWGDLDEARRQTLIDLYAAAELTVDALPYTPDFDWMRDAYNHAAGLDLSPHQFWRALSSARKTGILPRKER